MRLERHCVGVDVVSKILAQRNRKHAGITQTTAKKTGLDFGAFNTRVCGKFAPSYDEVITSHLPLAPLTLLTVFKNGVTSNFINKTQIMPKLSIANVYN